MNHLHLEKSPYLLQHKDNPVHWYPWGEEAFAEAQKQDKPVFLSIGYSTCYWCHVMEKDSFELQEVADVLNTSFISIKVDREERPDIDAIYMDAVQAMTGHGGWPMSMFLTPEKKPFYGGTFFYRQHFIEILGALATAWQNDREKIEKSASELTAYLSSRQVPPASSAKLTESPTVAFKEYRESFDSTHGGFGSAPKFPPAAQLAFLLRHYVRTKNDTSLQMVTRTLDSMFAGGIYDQIGGGFSRYSTDEKWLVPHFEKMLYDNALLAKVYFEAFQLTKQRSYREVACETLEYVLRDMSAPEGGFYAAEDAGEVDKEGEYYVWSHAELKALLSAEEIKSLEAVFSLPKKGNFEGNIVLSLLSPEARSRIPQEMLQKLRNEREKRKRPHLDDKVLTSWNALMISALAKGYLVTGEKRYLQAATNAALFIQKTLYKDGILYHRYLGGDARFKGNLDDYAFFAAALLDLYQCEFSGDWLILAESLMSDIERLFLDDTSPGYFYSQSDDVLYRKKELLDNALPAANGIMYQNLHRLFQFTGKITYRKNQELLLGAFTNILDKYPSAVPSVLQVLEEQMIGSRQLVISGRMGDSADPVQAYVKEGFFPHIALTAVGDHDPLLAGLPLLQGKESSGAKTLYFVCHDGRCELPTEDSEEALERLEINR